MHSAVDDSVGVRAYYSKEEDDDGIEIKVPKRNVPFLKNYKGGCVGESMGVVTDIRIRDLEAELTHLKSAWIDPITHDQVKKELLRMTKAMERFSEVHTPQAKKPREEQDADIAQIVRGGAELPGSGDGGDSNQIEERTVPQPGRVQSAQTGMELSDEDDHRVIQSIHLRDKDHSDEVKGRLCEAFQIDEEGVVFKLRNHRGPYILEVVKFHQNVTPKAKSVKISNQTQTMKKRIEDILRREIRELENKLVFLQRRLNEAEISQWRGMFRKNPLW
uniref:Uncharacterized protein n=1 Tax=Magallana gigas TaxID=29159 RepID=K1QTF9_MAGGI